MPLYYRRNIAVLSTGQQIAFPMARNGSVFRLRLSFADRDDIDDLPAGLSLLAGMTRAARLLAR